MKKRKSLRQLRTELAVKKDSPAVNSDRDDDDVAVFAEDGESDDNTAETTVAAPAETADESSPFSVVKVKVNDQVMSIDLGEELRIANIIADRQEVVSKMAFWGAVAAAAAEARDIEDLAFRHWHANSRKAHLDEDPKLASWKVETFIEATAEFRLMKERMIEADRNYASARVLQEAYRRKAKLIEVMTYIESGVHAGISGIGEDRGGSPDPRLAVMEEALRGRRRGVE